MLINTPDGWRSITGRPAPAIREATTYREVSAKMADELNELIPSMGRAAASQAAAMLAATLSFTYERAGYRYLTTSLGTFETPEPRV